MKAFRKAGVLLVLALVFVAALAILVQTETVQPVQAAVITPVAQTARADGSRVVEYMDTRAITQDTRVCFDLADLEIMDLQYVVDATAANQTTVSLQQTNIDPINGPFNTADTIVAVTTPTDSDGMTQTALFGRWNCVFADVANTNPVTLTIIGVAK